MAGYGIVVEGLLKCSRTSDPLHHTLASARQLVPRRARQVAMLSSGERVRALRVVARHCLRACHTCRDQNNHHDGTSGVGAATEEAPEEEAAAAQMVQKAPAEVTQTTSAQLSRWYSSITLHVLSVLERLRVRVVQLAQQTPSQSWRQAPLLATAVQAAALAYAAAADGHRLAYF